MQWNVVTRRTLFTVAVGVCLALLLLLPVPYQDVLLVAAVIVCAVFAALHFEAVWLAVLTLLPLIRLSGELFGLNGVTLSRILTTTLAIVFVFTVRERAVLHSLWRTNGLRWFGLFVMVNLVSAIYVFSAAAVLTALSYLEPFFWFAITFGLVRAGRVTTRDVLRALLFGAVFVALGGVYEWVTQQPLGKLFDPALKGLLDVYMSGYDSNRFGLGGRVSSFIAQPVNASLYWVMIGCIAIYYFKNWTRARWAQAAWIVTALFFLLLSGTRGGMLALAAAWLVWVVFGLQNARQRAFALVITGGAALGLVLLFPTLGNYLRASLEPNPDAIAARNVIWRVAVTTGLLQVFSNQWLLGYGPGMIYRMAAARQLPRVNGRYPLGGMENQYASILAETGIVGGLAYALFMFGVAQDGARMLRDAVLRAQGVLLLALFAAYFVFAATSWAITVIPILLLMAVYGALVAERDDARVQEKS